MDENVLIGGFMVAILVLGGGLFVLMDTTYYNATVVSKQFDYNTGRYYVNLNSAEHFPGQITVPVSSTTYYEIDVGTCKIIQETTIGSSVWDTNIYGDCP